MGADILAAAPGELAPPQWMKDWARPILGTSVVFTVCAILMIAWVQGLHHGLVNNSLPLQNASSANEFLRKMRSQNSDRWPGGPIAEPGERESVNILYLRLGVAADCFLLVPAYMSAILLEVLFLNGLARRWRPPEPNPQTKRWLGIARSEWLIHLMCLSVVLAAAFDIAENGMVIRAAEDAIAFVLADGTVEDVHLATTLKWFFLSLASFALTGLTLKHLRTDPQALDRRRL